jgi:hypothetical protein
MSESARGPAATRIKQTRAVLGRQMSGNPTYRDLGFPILSNRVTEAAREASHEAYDSRIPCLSSGGFIQISAWSDNLKSKIRFKEKLRPP